MESVDEHELAEQAFVGLMSRSQATPREWPAAADRIHDARNRCGLTAAQVAERVGINVPSFRDLEESNEEIFTNVSLAHLAQLADLLQLSLHALLFGKEAAVPQRDIPFTAISQRLGSRLAAEGVSVEQLGESIGWEIGRVLESPDALWRFNLVGLRDVCNAVGLDWVAALPDSTPPLEFKS